MQGALILVGHIEGYNQNRCIAWIKSDCKQACDTWSVSYRVHA
jgi:hypothetical protein